MNRLVRALTAGLALAASLPGLAEERFIVLASTTSTESSGLFGHLIPRFKAATGIDVRVVAVGTGQAFAIARNGDADVLLVHDTAGEEAFVRDGFGLERRDVMYNDYVIVGPVSDPAGIRDAVDAAEAFSRISRRRLPFVSRGDDSGTHRAELRIWKRAGVVVRDSWYRELGSGMGSTLNTAAAMDAYLLADRGSWTSFRNRRDLELLFTGDPALFNQYGSVLLHPGRHPHLRHALARQWHEWLLGDEGQAAIAAFRVHDQQVFFPNARQGPELQPDRAMRTVVAGRRSDRPGTE